MAAMVAILKIRSKHHEHILVSLFTGTCIPSFSFTGLEEKMFTDDAQQKNRFFV